jgi:ribosomal protein L15
MKPTYEGGQMSLFRRLPKRGFTNGPFRVEYTVVNLRDLQVFEAGSTVGREELRAKGLLTGRKGMPIKVLGDGELKQAITVKAERFSRTAEEKIKKAGGTVEWTAGKPKKRAPNFVRIAKDAKRAEALAAAQAPGKKGKGGKKTKDAKGAPQAKGKGQQKKKQDKKKK